MSFGTLAFALGDDVWVVRQCHVDDPALFWGHGIQGFGSASRGSPSGVFGDGVEFLCAALLVSFDVDDDVCALLNASVHQHSDDELNVAQGFAAATDEEASVFTFDFEDDGSVAEFVQDVCVDVDVHCGDEVGEDFAGYGLEFFAILDGLDRGFGPAWAGSLFLSGGDLGCFDCVGQLSGLWFGRCLGCVFRLSARLARLSGLTRGAGSGAFGALASWCLTAVAARLWPGAGTTLLRIFGRVFFLCLGLSLLLSTRPG